MNNEKLRMVLATLVITGGLSSCTSKPTETLSPINPIVTSVGPRPLPELTPTQTLTPKPTETNIPPTKTPTLRSSETPTFTPSSTPTETVKPTPEKPVDMLNLEGFTTVWSKENNWWEYFDVDGMSLAYWNSEGNEGKGRIEITFPKDNLGFRWLDLEKHKGLFVEWTPEQAEQAFLNGQKEGKIRLPLPFAPVEGIMTEDKGLVPFVCFPDLPEGTEVVAPYKCTIEKAVGVIGRTGEKLMLFMLLNEDTGYKFKLYVGVKTDENNRVIDPSLYSGVAISGGENLFKTTDQAIPLLPNNNKYRLEITSEENSGFSFDNILQNESGLLVCIAAE